MCQVDSPWGHPPIVYCLSQVNQLQSIFEVCILVTDPCWGSLESWFNPRKYSKVNEYPSMSMPIMFLSWTDQCPRFVTKNKKHITLKIPYPVISWNLVHRFQFSSSLMRLCYISSPTWSKSLFRNSGLAINMLCFHGISSMKFHSDMFLGVTTTVWLLVWKLHLGHFQ